MSTRAVTASGKLYEENTAFRTENLALRAERDEYRKWMKNYFNKGSYCTCMINGTKTCRHCDLRSLLAKYKESK